MLRKNYGCVRVDFAQPFSLKVSIYWNEAVLKCWHSSVSEDVGFGSVSAASSLCDLGIFSFKMRAMSKLAFPKFSHPSVPIDKG